MQKSRSLLAAVAALLDRSAGPNFFYNAVTPRERTPRTNKRYPEQSSRQALRGERRAQGGPGIELVDGRYVARGEWA